MKYEIAKELGINFKQGYNGDLSSRDNGYVGGYMVKRLIEPVSYTHLDVYKRQRFPGSGCRR